jgi:hypothetical protein
MWLQLDEHGRRNGDHHADSAVLSRSARSSWNEFLAKVQKEPIYVILGVQGSGTNLLRDILDSSLNFSVIKDKSIIYNAASKIGPCASAEAAARQFGVICSRLFPSGLTRKTSRRIKSNASFDNIAQHFDPTRITCAADLAHFVYAYGAFSNRTTLMAIKSDDLWETIGHIDMVLPNRRIVLLTRDFRDNLLSITKKDFGPVEPLVAARYVKHRFAYYEAEYHRTSRNHRFHVRYEELLTAPDAFVDRFTRQFALDSEGHTPLAVDTGRIRSGNVRKWSGLRTRQLAHCEAILRQELLTYGYGIECDLVEPPDVATWLAAKGSDTIKRIPQKMRRVASRLRT